MTFLTPVLHKPGAYRLRNERSGSTVATHLELAIDSKTRRRGLLGRDGLDEGHAMVIAPCNGIHTFFMRFPIDVLFVRKDGRVVKCARRVRPWRLSLALTAWATIELPAGAIESSGTRPGDRLALDEEVLPGYGRA